MLRRLFYIAWPLTALLILATSPWLPEQVGDPGQQTSRAFFVGVMLGLTALAGTCSSGFVAWLGHSAQARIGLPHRDYWMAPERREATLARLGEHLSAVGLMMLLLTAGIQGFALLQAQPGWPQPPALFWPLAAAALGLCFLVWWGWTYRIFPAPPQAASDVAPRHPRRPGARR